MFAADIRNAYLQAPSSQKGYVVCGPEFSLSLMEGIIDYKRDDSVAIPKMDKYITTARGQRRLSKTTAGWKLLVKWRDQSESWVKLSELKESHPVETAEFAKLRGIDDESAFGWWVPHTLKKRNALISAMKVRLRKTTHKYGIEIPTSVDHAMELTGRMETSCGRMR